MSKYYRIQISGFGGEYTYGVVQDSGDKNYLLNLINNNNLKQRNYYTAANGTEVDLYNVDNIQTLYAYGPDISDMSISLDLFDDSKCEHYNKNIVEDTDSSNLPINIFLSSNPRLLDYKKEGFDSSDLAWGSRITENTVTFSAVIELNDNENFEWKNVFIGFMLMDETLMLDDEIVETVLYIRDYQKKDLIEDFEEDFEEHFEEMYSDGSKALVSKIKTMEATLIDSEDQGCDIIEEFHIVKDMSDNILYEKSDSVFE